MRGGRTIFAIALTTACSSGKLEGEHAKPQQPSAQLEAPPGFGGVKAEPAKVTVDGQPTVYANVFARRMPNTDATRFVFVRSPATSCADLPVAGSDDLIAELVVSRYLTAREDATHPSKRPLSVASASLFHGKEPPLVSAGPLPFNEPFIEPTTATVMFGTIDLSFAERGSLRGTVMAQVCPQELAPEAIENAAAGLVLSYEGLRLRVRGVIERAGELRISTVPLSCDDRVRGDLDVTLTLDKKGGLASLSASGYATENGANYSGTRSAKKNAKGELELDVKGTLGTHPIELTGTAQVRVCPKK